MVCPQCYESDAAICPKAGDVNAQCSGFCLNSLDERTGLGEYSASLRQTLPQATRTADSVHLDALLGHTPSPLVQPELTDAEQNVIDNDFTTLADNNLSLAVAICLKRPNMRAAVEARMDEIANGANANVTARLTHVANRIASNHALQKDKIKDCKPGTGTAYKQMTNPQATLFQTIVKSHVRGVEMSEDPKEMFDTTTGKTYVPFGQSIKVNTSGQLMYCAHTFVATMIALKGEAPKVYFEFMRDVARVVDDKGPKFGQEYVDLLLRYLDGKRFPSMVALYKTGEPTRTFTELVMKNPLAAQQTPTKPPRPSDYNIPVGKIESPAGNGRVPYGPVAVALGGPGAGWIKKKCNRFHADPQRPCSAGISGDV